MPEGARADFETKRERILGHTEYVQRRLTDIMTAKLTPSASYHYCHYDEGSNPEIQHAKMSHFIEHDLSAFTAKTLQILSLLRKEDMDTLGTDKETEVASAFKSLVNELEEAGFSDPKGKPRNFWSGDLARAIAYADEGFVCDSQVATVSVLFDMCWLIQQSEIEAHCQDLYSFLPAAISSLYAYGAEGSVHVFLSSNKSNEPPSLQAGNYFWEGELPILARKHSEAMEAGLEPPKIEFILAVDKRETPKSC